MKTAVCRLQLNGKVVFVADETFEPVTVRSNNCRASIPPSRNSLRPDDLVSNCFGWRPGAIGRKIRTQEAALSGKRMAVRALAFAKKNFFAAFWIAAQV